MKRALFVMLLASISVTSFSQGMFGVDVGLGHTMAYKPRNTLTAEAFYLARLTPHIYAGGTLVFQQYSFFYRYGRDSASLQYGDDLNIRHKSAYVFLCPQIDLGIGTHKYVHLHAAFGPGIFVGGHQWIDQYQPFGPTASGGFFGSDTVRTITSYNIPTIVLRYAAGITERIPTHGYWNIILSQELSIIPNNLSKNGQALYTNYFAFTVGIMHKYPRVFVEY